MADDGQPIPKVGLRYTLRFQAVAAEGDFVSRTWFCKKVIMEQLHLKVDVVYCLQWNQQEMSKSTGRFLRTVLLPLG
ncbi:Histidinol dehydrogenase [Dissostichus eleginoides]|uniref:Histidinol dehydrogenase n=1 Tax=Dissostichus eleginoides TaxID=100907 RepID=A0AAD9B4U3_DISEL|nr:Histidinol dehydrogenase [Dissostichus eleginoides]